MAYIEIGKIGIQFYKKRYYKGDVIVNHTEQYEILDVTFFNNIYIHTVRRLADIVNIDDYAENAVLMIYRNSNRCV